MKKRINLTLAFICLSVIMTMAQNLKSFTLEDLIPGGSNYYNCSIKNLYGVQWWGNQCILPDVEEVKVINPKNGKESVLFTLEDINKGLETSTVKLRKMRALYDVRFPESERPVVMLMQPEYIVFLNFETKQVERLIALNKGAANVEVSPNHQAAAYTIGDALYVSRNENASQTTLLSPEFANPETAPKDHDLVYGQAVHRNEFGIMGGIFWSPKGNRLAYYRMDQSMVTNYPQVNIDTRIATLEPDKYPMAGMTSHKVTVCVYDMNSGKTVTLQAGDPTDRYFTNVSWAPDEEKIYVIELNRDQNHAQLVRYNAADGAREAVIYEETHPKYVEPQHPLTFLPWDSSKFIYQSQRDGFNHLYVYKTDGTLVKQITTGNWLVQSIVGFNEKKKEVIITSTEISPMQSNTYAVNVNTGKKRPVGNSEGVHSVQLSADGNYLIDNYSTPEIPRNIDIVATSNSKVTKNLFTAEDPWKGFNVPEIETGTIKAGDGKTDLYYRLIKPVNFDPNKKYPAIIYVYGGPHAQMLSNNFRYAARGWDIYMAQLGYVMLTVDNRGSENRGLEFENCTFRQLGTEEMKDQMEGVKLLKSLPYVDANRLGVHGWSFGGFMTTNLMLTHPDVFKVAVAGGPVIDWKYYEVMYGERYMDTPESNPEGYKNADLKQKAGNLKGRLELIIGGNDPTCVPQHTLSFIRACIDKGTHPDLFIYPGQGHNMVGRDRVHLHEHITRYFEDFLK